MTWPRPDLCWRLALLLVALASVSGSGHAQGLKDLVGGGTSALEVDGDAVLTAAGESFRRAVRRRLGLEAGAVGALDRVGELPRERRTQLAEELVDEFEREARTEVSERRGDGVLFASEVTIPLADLRTGKLDRLDEVMAALVGGFEPPPTRDAFDATHQFVLASLEYVFIVRNGWRDWATLVGATLLGVLVASALLRLLGRALGGAGGGRARQVARAALRDMRGPVHLMVVMAGLAVATRAIWLPAGILDPLRSTILVLLLLGAFWAAWRVSDSLSPLLRDVAMPQGGGARDQVLEVVRKALRLAVILTFAVFGLEVVFDMNLTAMVAGLGIFGLAVTLAAQDTLKDLLAALTIHLNGPFNVGDLVRFEGYFGSIEEIGFRMTRLRTLDGHLVTIPNARLVNHPVENVDARPHIRRRFHLDLPYETSREDMARAMDVVRDVIVEVGHLDSEQEVQVHFDELGAYSLRLLVQYYFEKGDYWAAKQHATEVDLALIERFRAEGLDLAFPTQTLHVVGAEPDPGGEDDPPGEDAEEAHEDAPSGGG